MHPSTGQLAFVFITALLLACAAAWGIVARYRASMRHGMSAPAMPGHGPGHVPDHVPGGAAPGVEPEPPADVSRAANRRAARRLTLLLAGLSALIACSSASLWLTLSFPAEPFAPKRAAVLALLQAWPVVPVLAWAWRWSRARLLGAMAAWGVLCFAVMAWRSIEPRPLELLLGIAVETGPAGAMVALLFMGNATRAAAPWLLPPLLGLVWASLLGLDTFAALVERRSPWLHVLPSWLGGWGAMALFALLPWVLAWWPLRRLGRALGAAYARRQLSELMVMFTAVWAIALLVQALTVASSAGPAGAALLLPLAWIPLVMALHARRARPAGRPPTLLVLRVFQHDAQVQALFDGVVERWRLSGNTVLIAGTDLADRTLDAADLFDFLDGGLAQRFIRTPAEVGPRLAAFELAPDADGRHRVNECYCHDTTWQPALDALVRRCDVVLMDLRGFQAHNAGCRHELVTLAASPRALHVVVLADTQTDRAAAAADTARAPPQRFVWVDAAVLDPRCRDAVLAALFSANKAITDAP